jgi:hypothetical protein
MRLNCNPRYGADTGVNAVLVLQLLQQKCKEGSWKSGTTLHLIRKEKKFIKRKLRCRLIREATSTHLLHINELIQ